jgi:hypothetical protein
MKELHFKKLSGRGSLYVADEGNYRYVLIEKSKGGRQIAWLVEIRERNSVRVAPIAEGSFRSKAEAIDWLARYRAPQQEKAEA